MSNTTVSHADATQPLYVGIDLGGTNIKIGILDSDGRTIVYDSIPTESDRGIEDAVQRMATKVHDILAETQIPNDEVVAIGLATPGTMDIPAGMILEPPNLPWRNFPIRDALAKAAGIKVTYANDANAAAYGEFWVGGGAEFSSTVFITLGTGVGGGIIVDGFPIDGHHSHGGEIGHIIIDASPEARMCGCGKRGHLEAYCSATALVARAGALLTDGRESSLSKRIAGGEELTALMIHQESEAGDMLATELVNELATHLGRGLATIAHTIDPEALIIGGAMTFGGKGDSQGEAFLAKVADSFRALVFPTLAEKTQLKFATLGGDAGYVGAAGIARRQHLQH